MSEDYSRFPVQSTNDDWRKEFAFQIDPITPSVTSTPVGMLPGQETTSMTDQLRSTPRRKPLRSSRLQSAVELNDPNTDSLRMATRAKNTAMSAPHGTKQLSPVAKPLDEGVVPKSLVSALQSTIKAQQPVRGVVVIPGDGKRRRRASEETGSQIRLRRRVRHGAVMLSILVIMMITAFALTPLGSGETSNPVVNGVMNWVRSQQQQWQIMARVTGQEGQGDNPASPTAAPPAALPKSQYVAIAQQAAIANGIPPTYFVQQINAESGFNPNAVSPSGAVGIAQMIPSTAAGIGANPYDPVSALNGAARLMAGYYKQYGGDYAKALAAYNAGSGTVNYAIKAGGANWMSFLPAETRNYIFKIMGV